MLAEIEKYLRLDKLPHIWCPGCGHGIILQAFLRAAADMQLDPDKLVVASGIGCSSRAVGYVDFNTLHTAHGRALSFATGIKVARPELQVVILAGDGDMTAIGGNHFIHAARRNIDLTVIIFNNFNYGMTGGQYSPTTFKNDYATTAPYGNIEPPFDMCNLAMAAGATYIARSTTYHVLKLSRIISDGIEHRGFSIIDVITGCPTCYGKFNNMRSAEKLLEWQRDHGVNKKQFDKLSEEEKRDKFVIGVIHNSKKPEYVDEYHKIIKSISS